MIDKEHVESFKILFKEIYKGNEQATDLSFKLLEIAHTWDDMIDKDKEITDDQINNAFIMSIFEIQNNPLWFQCGLNHHVLNVFLRWRDSTIMEQDENSTDDDLVKCFMLRAGIYDIFVIIAYYLHGNQWAGEIGPTVRRFYGENLKEFIKEIRDA